MSQEQNDNLNDFLREHADGGELCMRCDLCGLAKPYDEGGMPLSGPNAGKWICDDCHPDGD